MPESNSFTSKQLHSLTPTLARRLAVHCQRLTAPLPPPTAEGMMAVLRQIRCLQLDPIRAVERSHLLVLWSRLGEYDPAVLDKLLWQERTLFEYWAHAASIVLTEDYPIHQWHMARWVQGNRPGHERARAWIAENHELHDHILAELAERGPLSVGDLEDKSVTNWQSSGWTNNRNSSQMIDYLWTMGHLMVAHRNGIKRFWHLAEHCLPDWTPREVLDGREVTRHAAQHALRALGVATPAHIKEHFTRKRYPKLNDVLAELEASGCIVPVTIADSAGDRSGPWYIHTDVLPELERLADGDWQPRTTLLSPFDNLICDRKRTEQLWDYHFRSEIYVPKAKRQYGYYVLSILHGERLIGRLDPRLDRKQKRLTIHAVHAEPDAPLTAEVGQAIATAVADLARFLGAETIVYGDVPGGWRSVLKSTLLE